jgi:endonuclease YncB( thermonuclease family)
MRAMSKGNRAVRYRKAAGRSAGGSRAQFYASRRGAPADDGKRGGFPTVMVLLPLAAFSAVFLWDGPPPSFAMGWSQPAQSGADIAALYSASEAELARKRWPTTPAMLEAEQPDFARADFGVCGDGARVNCVVDGDTFWYRGEKIRIADINTPEVSEPDCAREASLGARATRRLRELLNDGAFSLGLDPTGRDTDRYGRKLRTVHRDGESIGKTLVEEGLAETWKGHRSSWC